MSRLLRLRWIVATALLVGVLAAMAGTAPAAPDSDSGLVPASGRLAGLTGGQLLGREIRHLFKLPPAKNPLAGHGRSCFPVGHNDRVLILWTRPPDQSPARCAVKPGTPVFLFGFFIECSNVEAPPFFGATAADQRTCAISGLEKLSRTQVHIQAIRVCIDGAPATDIMQDRFRAVSPQMRVNLPKDNILGVSARTATFVAAAWVAMIRPLAPGMHTIRVAVVVTNGPPTVTSAVVNVVPGHNG